ncbi:hypothetical protein D0T11_20825 [Hymenobacter rubripertinctus]|uniref:Uncharacterized protein n=1 Tax=Hymenobacter rubripertinctus TaxID=2029981 RepID=A0A418QJ33_9BACT|nr:hypothetical protein D0T11_20825 [Hymenobacter rubripertinctus]
MVKREGVAKVKRVFYDVIRQFFPVFSIIALMLLVIDFSEAKRSKGWFGISAFTIIVLYHVFFLTILLALSLFTHMPPRIMQPVTILYLVCVFVMYMKFMPNVMVYKEKLKKYKIIIASLLAIGFLLQVKLLSGIIIESKFDQNNKEKYLYYLSEKYKGKLLIEGGLSYANLNPLRSYGFYNYSKVYSLSGWPAFDPSQRAFRQQLTGYADFGPAMKKLIQRPDAVWVLTPDLSQFLPIYFSARGTGADWNIQLKKLPDTPSPYVHECQASLITY